MCTFNNVQEINTKSSFLNKNTNDTLKKSKESDK